MFIIEKLGLIGYNKALDYQNELVRLKQNGSKDDYLLLLEHNHVFTMGKGADSKNILDNNIPVIITNRGGDLTYHGPGQLIGYIILDLKAKKLDLHQYLRKIEQLIIEMLKDLNIDARRIDNLTGVWVKNRKIASIGIGVKKGITMHGFALNVNPDLSYFSKINPCGLDYRIITSLDELKKNHPIELLQNILFEKFIDIFQQ